MAVLLTKLDSMFRTCFIEMLDDKNGKLYISSEVAAYVDNTCSVFS